MLVTVERVMENSRSMSHWGLGVPVKILHDPAVHGGHGLHAIGAGNLADLAENKVVHPAQLGRDDLRRLPRRRDGGAGGFKGLVHSIILLV